MGVGRVSRSMPGWPETPGHSLSRLGAGGPGYAPQGLTHCKAPVPCSLTNSRSQGLADEASVYLPFPSPSASETTRKSLFLKAPDSCLLVVLFLRSGLGSGEMAQLGT